MKNSILIAQSGGPTAAINATLVGILQGVRVNGIVGNVYGAKNGIQGVLQGQLIKLNQLMNDSQAMNTLTYTPSSALGTCRYRLNDWRTEEAPYLKIMDFFYQYEIRYFIYIGGNDSMDTVDKLSEYCNEKGHDFIIVGAPKTIDNDLNLTDHSPGFGSAAKYVATTISELSADIHAYNFPAVTIVEIMGRNAGWLTASAAIPRINEGAGADLIYLCEKPFDTTRFLEDVREKLKRKPGVLVAVSEGVKNSKEDYISDEHSNVTMDCFGHQYIAGAGHALEQLIRNEIGCKVRSIELNLMQRSAAHIASETDLQESLLLGQKALNCALTGQTGQMAALRRMSNDPYQVEFISVPVHDIANHEKQVPLEWITPNGNDVTEEMITYLKPLIQGEVNITYKNGLPIQLKLYE